MKKSFYFLMMFIGLALTSCEPMEDIHDEIDTSIDNSPVQGVVDYTLTDDDYTDKKEGLGLSFTSFNSVDDAKAMIPVLLDMKYPVWGEGSLVNVTFNLYDPIRIQEVTMTDADYQELGLSADYITDFYQLQNFLKSEFPQAKEGAYAEVTYDRLSEEIAYTFTSSDYDDAGAALAGKYPDPAANAAKYSSFDVRETSGNYWNDEMILEAINVVLSAEFDDVTGQTYNVSYDVYYPATLSMSVVFDGNSYVRIGGTSYEVSSGDFDLIETEFATAYPAPAESAGKYSNFERRSSNDAYWSDSMILEALDFLLKEKFPNAAEGAEYDVTYKIYNGSAGSEILSLVFENGDWVENTNATIYTVEESTVLAFTNNSWGMPLSLEAEDYTAMGQRYPNFSDEDEAIYKIGIFLGLEYPYAEEGDFAALTYDLYTSGSGVSAEYLNYFFNGDEWEYIPSVVEQSLQFGYENGAWAPDNTVKYTLAAADYSYIASELVEVTGYELQAGNLASYGNFNTAGGPTSWSDAQLLVAMQTLLDHIAPNAEVGQKYVLNFTAYVGGGYEVKERKMIKTAEGWELNN